MTLFIIYVADPLLSKHFYTSVFNNDPVLDVPGMIEFQLSDQCKLGIMPEKGIAKILKDKTPHPSKGNGIPRCEIYLFVENIQSYIDRTVKAGGKLISPLSNRDWGDNVCYFSDPDGHILALAEK